MNFGCRIGFHDWDKWVTDKKGTIARRPYHYSELEISKTDCYMQKRECKACGKLQLKVSEYEL